MTTRRTLLTTLLLGALVAGTAAAVPADAEVAPGSVGQARAEAVQARNDARRLAAEVEAAGPKGIGSQAFADRHAALAEKHAAHPGNAAAVHAALAAGLSPSTAKQGKGAGRGNGGVPPGQAKKAEALGITLEALREGKGPKPKAERTPDGDGD